MARRPAPAPNTGLPPAFLAIAVILMAAIGVIFVVSQMNPPPEEEPVVEEVDPFEGLAPEVAPNADPFAGASMPKKDTPVFDDMAKPREEQLWKDAKAIGLEGMDLARAAADAKTAGNQAGFKENGAAAKEKLKKALDLTLDWENQLVEDLGAQHPEVKQIQRTRNIWRNQLVALKKTVGF